MTDWTCQSLQSLNACIAYDAAVDAALSTKPAVELTHWCRQTQQPAAANAGKIQQQIRHAVVRIHKQATSAD